MYKRLQQRSCRIPERSPGLQYLLLQTVIPRGICAPSGENHAKKGKTTQTKGENHAKKGKTTQFEEKPCRRKGDFAETVGICGDSGGFCGDSGGISRGLRKGKTAPAAPHFRKKRILRYKKAAPRRSVCVAARLQSRKIPPPRPAPPPGTQEILQFL